MGTHRLINFKNGSQEIGFGLLIDFFLNAITFLITQTLNHGYLSTDATDAGQVYEFSDMQSTTVVFKFLLIIDLLAEFALYAVELYFFNRFRARKVSSKKKYSLSERQKRQKYGKPYAFVNAIWTAVCLLLILIISAGADQQVCRTD